MCLHFFYSMSKKLSKSAAKGPSSLLSLGFKPVPKSSVPADASAAPGPGAPAIADAVQQPPAQTDAEMKSAPASRSISAEKRKPDNNSDSGGRKQGQKKQKQHTNAIKADWYVKYDWLDKENCERYQRLICRVCTEMNGNSKFNLHFKERCTGGSSSLRADTLKEHHESPTHAGCVRALADKKRAETEGTASSLLRTMSDREREAIVASLRATFWLTKQEIAHLKFPSLRALLEVLGVKSFDVLSKENAKYISDVAVRQFIESIAVVVEQDQLDDMRSSPAVCVLVDESTDNANVKQLLVYIRYVKDGVSRTGFLGIANVNDGGAQTIFTAVTALLEEKKIRNEQVLAFGSDGASPMIGTSISP